MANIDNLNPEKLLALASQLGMGKGSNMKEGDLRQAAERLNGKSDAELMEEVRKLKASFAGDAEKLKKQLGSLKMVRNMLNNEQKDKFDMIMRVLEED